MYPYYRLKFAKMQEKTQEWPQSRIDKIKNEGQTAASKKGEQAEQLIMDLCRILRGVKDVWGSTKGSALDQCIKGDLVIELEDSEDCFILQVKSSKAGAEKHEALPPPIYKDKRLPKTPVIYTEGKSPWELLMELSQETGLALRPEISAAVTTVEKYKATGCNQAPTCLFRPAVAAQLVRLNVLVIKRGEYYIP